MKSKLIAVATILLALIISGSSYAKQDIRDLIKFSTVLKVGEYTAYVNNYKTQINEDINVVPLIINSRAMIPLRFVGESLNAEVMYDEYDRKAYVEYNGKEITISEDRISSDDNEISTDVGAVIKNDRFFVPLRAIAEAMNKEVYYKDNIIVIYDKKTTKSVIDESDINELNKLFDIKEGSISFYVSPNGSDSNDGSIDKPFKTISYARDYIRKQDINSDITVYLRKGTYVQNEPLVFDENDSGKGYNRIIYKAYEDEVPVISGAQQTSGWEIYRDSIYRCYIGENKTVDAVYENGKSCIKARFPNMTSDTQEWFARAEKTDSNKTRQCFKFKNGDIPKLQDKDNLGIYIFPGGSGGSWMWHMEYKHVKDFDYKSREITLDGECAYDLGSGTHYYINGALELLDSEGEFYYDKHEGMLYYMPYGGEISQKTVTYSVTDDIVIFQGNEDLVKNIEFSGIEISNNGTPEKIPYRSNDSYSSSSGVRIENGENIVISDCNIHDIGGRGVQLGDNTYNNKIIKNRIEHTGYGGVALFGTKYNFGIVQNTISDNFIADTGRYNNGEKGIRITAYSAGYNNIVHNTITKTTHMGICIGNTHWENNISYNDVSDANRTGEDTGVIYVNYQCGGQKVRNNYVHDCIGRFSGFFGIYYDESGSEDGVTENNIVSRMGAQNGKNESGFCAGGLLLKGKVHSIKNNFFVGIESTRAALCWENGSFKATIPQKLSVKNNIIYNKNGNLMQLGGEYSDKTIEYMDKNLYFSSNGRLGLGAPVSSFDAWRRFDNGRFDKNSLTTNPGFMDEENQDYRLRYDSDAYDIGIRSLDVSVMGARSKYKYIDKTSPINQVFVKQSGRAKSFSAINLKSGENAALEVSAKNDKRQFMDLSDAKITYTSENPAVAEIDDNGRISAKSFGIAKVNVLISKNGIKTASIYVLVDDEIEKFELICDNTAVKSGSESNVNYIVKTKLGQKSLDFIRNISFNSNSDAVTVSNTGKLKVGNKEENFKITANVVTSIGNKSASLCYSARNADKILEKVVFENDETLSVKTGCESLMRFAAYDANGNKFNIEDAQITVSSNDESIVKIKKISSENIVCEGVNYGLANVQVTVSLDGMEKTAYTDILSYPSDENTAPWKTVNFGKSKGGMRLNKDNTINILTSGNDFFNPPDDGTFIYRECSAKKVRIECEIRSVTGDSITADTAFGPMIRADLTDTSHYVMFRYKFGVLGSVLTYRNTETAAGFGSVLDESIKTFDMPVKIRVEKDGDIIKSSILSGDKWYETKEVLCPMPEKFYIGAAGFSNVTGVFDEIVISEPIITILEE